MVILACRKLKQMTGGRLRLMAHANPLCTGLIKPAALDSLNLLINPPNNKKPSKMGQNLARPTHGLFGGNARTETDKFWPLPIGNLRKRKLVRSEFFFTETCLNSSVGTPWLNTSGGDSAKWPAW